MPFLAASVLIQILCALHVYNTGRKQIWILIILFFSLLGCTAYFAFEIMPELIGPHSRRAQQARARSRETPLNALKRAEARLEDVDTAANRLQLGDAYFGVGATADAIEQYRMALDRVNGRDAKIETKLATALFETGDFKEALKIVGRLEVPLVIGEADRLSYLRARILVELGRSDEAVQIYADIVTRMPGEEARCHFAALLLSQGKTSEARALLSEVVKGVERMSRAERAVNATMFDWATEQLKTLRT